MKEKNEDGHFPLFFDRWRVPSYTESAQGVSWYICRQFGNEQQHCSELLKRRDVGISLLVLVWSVVSGFGR